MAEVPEDQEQEPEDQEVVEEEVQEEDVEAQADEAHEAQVDGEESQPAPKESRRNHDIRILRERAQAAERLAQEARDEAARIRQAQSQAQSVEAQRLAQEAEDRRIASIEDPNQRYQQQLYHWAKKRDDEQRRSAEALEARVMDQSDRASYEAKALANPLYSKYRDEVERKLVDMRANGANAPREACLKWILGEKQLDPKTTAKVTKQKQQAQARVANARGQPNGVRSDGSGSRKVDAAKAREERLRDVPI